MKFSATQIAYHLTLTKGTVDDNGTVEFITIPLLCLTGLIFRLYQLAGLLATLDDTLLAIAEKVNVLGKCLAIGFNSLTWAIV